MSGDKTSLLPLPKDMRDFNMATPSLGHLFSFLHVTDVKREKNSKIESKFIFRRFRMVKCFKVRRKSGNFPNILNQGSIGLQIEMSDLNEFLKRTAVRGGWGLPQYLTFCSYLVREILFL